MPPSDDRKPFHNPFAGLRDKLGPLPQGPAPAREPPREEKGPARAEVRLERKGRGGKEVTIIEKLALAADELDRWARDLKQALGTGGAVDGDAIVLQGDCRARAAAALRDRGVRTVTIG